MEKLVRIQETVLSGNVKQQKLFNHNLNILVKIVFLAKGGNKNHIEYPDKTYTDKREYGEKIQLIKIIYIHKHEKSDMGTTLMEDQWEDYLKEDNLTYRKHIWKTTETEDYLK